MIGTGPFAVSEAFIWSVALGIAGITGQYIIGKKSSKGYIVGMATQIMWFAFAVQTKQYGFIMLSGMYFVIYFKSWKQWRLDEKAVAGKADHNATPIPHKDARAGG
jgi:hypothetical protein